MKLSSYIAGWIAALSVVASLAFAQEQGKEVPGALGDRVQQVISGQINAFKSREHEKAFGFAAPSIRKIFKTTDQFIGMVKGGYGAIYGAQGWSFGRNRIVDDKLYQEVILTGPAGADWVALYTLKKQGDGSWKITGVQLKRAQTSST